MCALGALNGVIIWLWLPDPSYISTVSQQKFSSPL